MQGHEPVNTVTQQAGLFTEFLALLFQQIRLLENL